MSDRNISFSTSALCHSPSTFRAKGFSYLASIHLLCLFHRYFHLPVNKTVIQAYIDNKGLIQRLSHGQAHSIKYNINTDSDLICKIHSVENSLGISISRNHVRSHKFNHIINDDDIPLPLYINKCCNRLAKAAYTNNKLNPHSNNNIIFASTSSFITFDGARHATNIAKLLVFASQDAQLLQHIVTKQNWDSSIPSTIAWDHISTAMLRSTSKQKKAYTKLAHQLWPTTKHLSKRTNSIDSRCFHCQRLYEDWQHIFCCLSPSSVDFQLTALKDLRKSLQSLHFSAPMITTMLSGIRQ